MTFRIKHHVTCECGADLTVENSIKVEYTAGFGNYHVHSRVEADGMLVDNAGSVVAGNHAGSYCAACYILLDELEIPEPVAPKSTELTLLEKIADKIDTIMTRWREAGLLDTPPAQFTPAVLKEAAKVIPTLPGDRLDYLSLGEALWDIYAKAAKLETSCFYDSLPEMTRNLHQETAEALVRQAVRMGLVPVATGNLGEYSSLGEAMWDIHAIENNWEHHGDYASLPEKTRRAYQRTAEAVVRVAKQMEGK